MLAEERAQEILRILREYGSVTVQKLMELTGASESTLRRDLNTMDKKGMLTKVHGGAIAAEKGSVLKDSEVVVREELNREDKRKAARYAASLIQPDDLVYLDAGTTTGYMIDFLTERNTVFVTNAVMHARKLVSRGYQVYLPGGELKAVTEALIGEDAIRNIRRYHFTKGFWGTNGIDVQAGYTTPDVREARMKECAMQQCRESYILSDVSKLGQVAPVTFAAFEDARVILSGEITENKKSLYKKYKNIIYV